MSRGLPQNVANLLEKAKESALLAVDIYNKPKTAFRSGGFVVLMCIAWTSLFHAVFEKNKVKYYYKEPNGRYKRVKGEKRTWDLQKSTKEFFIELRNKIEHRFMPVLDPVISGECQALLLNLEDTIVQKFEFLEKVYWGTDSVWSVGFFVSTVGVDEEVIQKYVEMQGKEDSGQAELEL